MYSRSHKDPISNWKCQICFMSLILWHLTVKYTIVITQSVIRDMLTFAFRVSYIASMINIFEHKLSPYTKFTSNRLMLHEYFAISEYGHHAHPYENCQCLDLSVSYTPYVANSAILAIYCRFSSFALDNFPLCSNLCPDLALQLCEPCWIGGQLCGPNVLLFHDIKVTTCIGMCDTEAKMPTIRKTINMRAQT